MKANVSLPLAMGVLALASTARADTDPYADDDDPDTVPAATAGYASDADYYEVVSPAPYSYAWTEPRMKSQIGVGLVIGGGITGFTDALMRDTISNNVGGLWDARLSIGTHVPIGFDISYLGSAAELRTLDDQSNGTLVGTAVEGAVRFNVLPHFSVNPYVFAGLGWQRYDVRDASFAQSDTGLRNEDDLLVVPMGAGISYRATSGLTADVRGTFRAADDSGLLSVREGTDGNAELHTWEASAAVGYEF